MTGGAPHSALREWRRQMLLPQALAAMAATGSVLGLVGPFGTDRALGLLPRLAYWLVMVGATYGAALLVSLALAPKLRGLGRWGAVLSLSALSSVAVTAAVLAINWLTFQRLPQAQALPQFLATLVAITMIVTFARDVVVRDAVTSPAAALVPAPPPLLDRLPLDKRGPLVALSVEDHYTRVRTTRGEALLLLRLSDAVREVGDTPGARVHRSHWVAFGQVQAARRRGDGAVLTMSDGREIPVSRANLTSVKEAGLLPR